MPSSVFRFLKRRKSWRRDERGATAVEFGLIMFPFFLLFVGMVETTLFFTAGSILEGSALEAARTIRTGVAQQSGDPVTQFEQRLCEMLGVLIPCGDIVYEVQTVPDDSFSGAENIEPQFDGDGNMVSGGFSPGDAGEIVIIRLAYRYEFMTPFLGQIMGSGSSNSRLLMSTVVMRNEPYEFGS